ncbi:MAG: hypothetical protein KKB20_05250 [Proteobacteria bacterium]|nr:hypothetical protein [Pseudomonadota bacterium]
MKLILETPEPSRPWTVFFGLLRLVCGVALFWFGLNSVLVGWAYFRHKGAFVPLSLGLPLALIGFWLLQKGLGQVMGRRPADSREDFGL